MCGFSFCVSQSNNSIKNVKLMNSKIAHRGPDKEKFINSKNLKKFKNKKKIKFCAGFRRLKIIDLSNRANQPMFYDDRYLIVFNGLFLPSRRPPSLGSIPHVCRCREHDTHAQEG